MAESRRASALLVEGEASESEDETLDSGHSCPGSPGIHKQKLVWVSPKIRFLDTPCLRLLPSYQFWVYF